MKTRKLALTFFVLGLLVSIYLSWALYRTWYSWDSEGWPRPLPFPDGWLLRWHDRLDIAHPITVPMGMKPHGEIYRLCKYLSVWLGSCLFVTLLSFLWLRFTR